MKFIQTSYLPAGVINNLNLNDVRVYKTTCEDRHFGEIIDLNKEYLDGEYAITNILYVLMDNTYVEDSDNFYASISIREYRKPNEVSYYPCVITCEKSLSYNIYLKHLLEMVIDNLSSDNSYFSFDKEHKDNIRIMGNEQSIAAKILALCNANYPEKS